MNPMNYTPRLSETYPAISVKGRRFKVYGIFSDPNKVKYFPDHEELADRISDIVSTLSEDADHGLGFAILHLALDGNYLLITQWLDANMLQHRVYKCAINNRKLTNIESIANTGIIACVWELEIMKFERDAWVRTMLSASPDSDSDALPIAGPDEYMKSIYSGWV